MLPPRLFLGFAALTAVLLSPRQHSAWAFVATGIARPIGGCVPINNRPFAIQSNEDVAIAYGVKFWEACSKPIAAVLSRLDTMRAGKAPLLMKADSSKESPVYPVSSNETRGSILLQANLGFLGHTGLLLASTVLVLVMQQLFRTIQQTRKGEELQASNNGGIMNRCPWPFIFTHDPIQGMKDPPTWILITWIALWRIIKMTSFSKV
jgi:hypothetical protein